jgi:rhodanese-related sulfurtransferase
LTEEQLVALFDNKANGLVILDTRDAQSFAQARLQGAVNAPAGEIAPQALRDLVASAPKASVVIFCQDAECKGAEKVASAAAEAGIAKEQIRTFKADTLENLQARGLPVDESESTNTRS